jgi:hypothetical protein
MSGVKVTTALAGAEQLIRALKLANPATKARVVAAIKKNTKAVTAGAIARAPKVTGEMASTIRDTYSEDGLTGFVRVGLGKLPRRSKATTAKGITRAKGRTRKIGRGAYAPVVERGDPRRHHKAHPFLMPSYEADKPTAMAEIKAALDNTVKDIEK